jgi:elongation factor P
MYTSDFRKGAVIMYQNEPFRIVEFQHVNPGKGAAFVRTKLKAVRSEKVLEITFKSGEQVEEADIQNMNAQFLYSQGDEYFFMITDNYEQHAIAADVLGNGVNFLKPEMEVVMVLFNGQPIDVQLPAKMVFEVTEVPPGVRGNTATNVTKEATIETGAKVKVPAFINVGDKIRVNTETGEYDTRV